MGDKNLHSLQEKYEALEANYRDLEGKNFQLANKIDNVSQELKKERTTIQKKDKKIEELEDTRRKIEEGLKEQIASQVIKLEEMEGKLKVTFVDKILFNSGSVQVNPRGQELLLEFAESFRENGSQNIVVEGQPWPAFFKKRPVLSPHDSPLPVTVISVLLPQMIVKRAAARIAG
jgi:flagellar motor protein MotB